MESTYFDGEDWIHIFDDLCLVYPEKRFDFVRLCTKEYSLFTKKYKIKFGDIVLDVGSGVGSEISIFAKQVGINGHVYAIEADPNLYKKNLKVVKALGLTNVTCINAAVMDKDGFVDIGIFSFDGIDSSINTDGAKEVIKVKSTSLDSILKEYGIDKVDYLKMNIEGAEKYALPGISNLNRVKNWCISTHDFVGIPTKNFVVNFFNDKGIFVSLHEEIENASPAMGGYIYVKTPQY